MIWCAGGYVALVGRKYTRTVILNKVYLGKYEVTQEQYRRVCYMVLTQVVLMGRNYLWVLIGAKLPVRKEYRKEDAMAFCKKLSEEKVVFQ